MSKRLAAHAGGGWPTSAFLAIFALCSFGAIADMGNFNKQAGRPQHTKQQSRQEADEAKKDDRDAKANKQTGNEKPVTRGAPGKETR